VRTGRAPAARLGRRIALIALAGIALSGCGEDPRLAWEGRPRVNTPETLPNDRILMGRLRNVGGEAVELRAADLALIDRGGRRTPANAIFLQAFVHGLFPPTREPARLPGSEEQRTGRLARIEPGTSIPLTAAWRRSPGNGDPVRLSYGSGSVGLP